MRMYCSTSCCSIVLMKSVFWDFLYLTYFTMHTITVSQLLLNTDVLLTTITVPLCYFNGAQLKTCMHAVLYCCAFVLYHYLNLNHLIAIFNMQLLPPFVLTKILGML